MPDDAPAELPTATLVSRVISYSVAVLGGLAILIASFIASGGDFLAPMSFRGIVAVPMWVPFALGAFLLLVSVGSLIGPIRLLAQRARAKRNPGATG